MEIVRREFSRKDVLKMGLLGGAALLLPLERVARTQLAVAGRIPESQLPKPFQVPFSIPDEAKPVCSDATTDYYQMTMKQSDVEIIPGLKTKIWGYEGATPGPTIHAKRDRDVVVRHINQISDPLHKYTSVHLHGNASPPQYDGYANDTTLPGQYKDYRYPNKQDARTLWYHDHGVHHTSENAYMGLAGFYLTHDALENELKIPKGPRYDIPLVIRDAIFATDGSLIYEDDGHSNLFGDVILANGKPWPAMKVERRKYRFRVLNASISRGFKLALSPRRSFHVIATDGGLMPAPVETDDLLVGMAERYEIVIDFSNYAIGEQVVLRNLGVPNNRDYASTDRIMRFDVVGEATDLSNNEVPLVLNPENEVMKLDESQAVRRRVFEFGRTCVGGTDDGITCVGGTEMWTINNKIWDPNRVDANPNLDDVEVWELVNKSGGWNHPIHLHLVDFKILSRTGGDNPGVRSYERGPKDVAYVGEGETVRVLMRFSRHKGKYMIHCHNLVHEDHDMMTQFEVGKDGTPWSSVPAKPIETAPPLCPNTAAPVIVPLGPAPNSRTRDTTPTIVARVSDSQTDLAKANIRLFLDNREIRTFGYNQATNTLAYTSGVLRLGFHTVRIVANDAGGRSTTRTWGFTVIR